MTIHRLPAIHVLRMAIATAIVLLPQSSAVAAECQDVSVDIKRLPETVDLWEMTDTGQLRLARSVAGKSLVAGGKGALTLEDCGDRSYFGLQGASSYFLIKKIAVQLDVACACLPPGSKIIGTAGAGAGACKKC